MQKSSAQSSELETSLGAFSSFLRKRGPIEERLARILAIQAEIGENIRSIQEELTGIPQLPEQFSSPMVKLTGPKVILAILARRGERLKHEIIDDAVEMGFQSINPTNTLQTDLSNLKRLKGWIKQDPKTKRYSITPEGIKALRGE